MALSLDVDAMMERYAEGLKSLQQTGAAVFAFTAPDLGAKPLFRGPTRPATVTENLRWASSFAAPWAVRRLRRITPGAGVAAKSSGLTRVI